MKKRILSVLLTMCLMVQFMPAVQITAFATDTEETTETTALWEYATYGEGVVLTKYNGDATDVYAPSTVVDENGERLNVLKLGDDLFNDNDSLNSVTLGEGITEIGVKAFYDCDNLVCIVTNETLTTIGDQAFDSCDVFNSIILYDTVTTIGENAFANCPKVTIWCNENATAHTYATENSISYEILNPDATPETYVENGVTYYIMNGEAYATAFDGSVTEVVVPAIVEGYPVVDVSEAFKNSAIVSISLPETVQTIYDYAFYSCNKLTSVDMPQNVKSIGNYAFSGCRKLEKIIIPEQVRYIGENAYLGCINAEGEVVIPEGVAEISYRAFMSCTAVSEFKLPSTLKIIGGEAFAYCEFKEIELPQGLEEIGAKAFDWTNIKTITIPDSVVKIGDGAFSRCYSLTEVVIPSSVTSGGGYIFNECRNIKRVVFSEGCTQIFYRMFWDCENLTEIVLPDSIDTIGTYAFDGCTSLEKFTVPEKVTAIPAFAFDNCTNLKEVVLHEGITKIAREAFEGCVSLEQIAVPQSVIDFPVSSSVYNLPLFLVLCVYENSFAHEYAVENNILYHIINEETEPEWYVVDGVTYYIQNGEAYIIGYDGTTTELVIPETVADYPVIGVKCGFSGSNIKSIVLPESLCVLPERAFSYCSELVSATVPGNIEKLGRSTFGHCSNLTEVTLGTGITEIGMVAFDNCVKLTDVTLPDTLTIIDIYAFTGCTSLRQVIIPENVTTIYSTSLPEGTISFVYENTYAHQFMIDNNKPYVVLSDDNAGDKLHTIDGVTYVLGESSAIVVYYDEAVKNVTVPAYIEDKPVISIGTVFKNSAIENVILPETITTIDKYAFENCASLESITIPESVTSIEAYAFNFCSALKKITIPEGVTIIDRYVFEKCASLESITIPGSVTSIGDHAFYSCSALKKITIPEGVTTIGKEAFGYCGALTEITLPSTLKTIDKNAFWYCGFEHIDIPDGVESIGKFAFVMTKLKEIVIPESVTTIGVSAFSMCKYLEKATLPSGITEIPAVIFGSCEKLTDVNIPEGVEKIGNNAFQSTTIKNIEIPDSVTVIEEKAFYFCTELESLVLPENLKSIGQLSFAKCTNLKEVKLPDGLESIGENAFSDCTNISTIIVPESVTSLSADSFPATTILMVKENSYAHTFAVENNLLYFIMRETENPEISYGSGITGTVTYSDGSVASGATVEIVYDDGVVKETVETDETGAYEFTYAEVGRYTIRATDASGKSSTTQVSVKRMNAFDVFLTGDTSLVLKQGYTISGTVSEASTVTLTDGEGNVIATVETDGAFSITDVPNGEYILKAESANGTITQEITVYNGDVSGVALVIPTSTATIWGYVEVEDRELKHHRRNWVDVTLYNSEGVAVASRKTDADGKYTFSNVPLDEYSIVAETHEMRPDKKHKFDRSHKITGYAYVSVTEATTYEVETIVLYEENDNLATISGKVTAHGETQDCEVTLVNVFRHEIAKCSTGKNGKYTFKNIPDGLYFITAVTNSDGMGFRVVVVRNGKVYGETDITVYKSDKITEWEGKFEERIPVCSDRNEAWKHKDKIAAEKHYYDGLSKKEKKQLSKSYIDRLEKLCGWIADAEVQTEEGIVVEQSGLILSGDELGAIEEDQSIQFELTVTKSSAHDASTDGVHSREDFMHHEINDTAGKYEVAQYYEITMSKTDKDGKEKQITDICKDTDAHGKLRITMPIPEEHRGYKHYSVIHMHNGVPVTLTDLDDDPDTITIEVDKFSTFVLVGTANEMTEEEIDVTTTYSFGQSVQIGLIEPWFLKANLLVYTDDISNPIDYSTLVDYGVYFVRKSELDNPDATQSTITSDEILNNSNVVKCSKAEGTASIDGNLLTANYDKGIYTYELDDSVFVMFYIDDGNGIQYAPIRERNIKSLVEARKDDAVAFTNELERNVYAGMDTLKNDVDSYRGQFTNIEEMPKQDAPTLADYVASNGAFETETSVNYTFGNSVQIVLVEPWGLKFNAIVSKTGESQHIDYTAVEEYGAIVFYDTEGEIANGTMSKEELMTREDAYVFSSKAGDASIDGDVITALYNKGIYTYQLNSNAYVMFYVKDEDGYHYGEVKTRNAYSLAKTRANDENFGELERVVYASMVAMYDAVTAYRDDYFSEN